MQSPRPLPQVSGHRNARLACLLVVLIGVLGLVLAGAQRADAHARLIAATPAGGSALPTAPTEFRLQLSEPVDLQFSRADLLASDGTPYPLASIETETGDDQVVIIRPTDPASLPNGVYTLVWRMMSATDGHATTGTLAFSIGTGVQPTGSTSLQASFNPPWWRVGLHWLNLLSLLMVVGGVVFSTVVARPLWSNSTTAPLLHRVWFPIWRTAVVVAVLGQIAALHNQAIVAANSGFASLPSLTTYRRLLFDATFGEAWLTRLSLLVTLVAVVHNNHINTQRWRWTIGSLIAVAVLLTVPVAGHAAGESERTLAIATDWLHLCGAAIWLGGLCYLLATLLALRREQSDEAVERAAQLVRRFSTMALVTVGVLIVTGVTNAIFHVSGPRTLRDQNYGVTLIAKHLLILVVLIPAAINVLLVRPRLTTSSGYVASTGIEALKRQLRIATITVIAEITLGIVIVLASANLAELPPADGPLTTEVAPKIVTINQRETVAGVGVWLLGRLDGSADDRFTVAIANPDDAPPLQRLIVETSLPGTAERGELTDRFDAEPIVGGVDTYFFRAVRLGLQGVWDVSVIVRRAGVDDLRTSFTVDTTQAGVPPPRVSSDAWRLPRIPVEAWGLFALAVIVALGGVVGVKRLPELEPLAATLILMMIVLIAAGFTVSGVRLTIPVTADTDLENPAIADPGSVTRGETLYASQCLACHGPAGAGVETPDPEHGHGSSSNLTDRQSRLQRDGDLYFSITNGVPGTDMPAYDVALSDAERWDLVTYLRELLRNAETGGEAP